MKPGRISAEVRQEVRSPPGLKASRRRRLSNLASVKRGLADAIRALEDDHMDAGKARALTYAYSVLAGIMQGVELEERVAKLEATQSVQ